MVHTFLLMTTQLCWSTKKKEPRANRVFGPIPRELSEAGYQKIVSLAPEVV